MPETMAQAASPPLPRLDTGLDDVEAVKRACAGFRDVYALLRAEVGRAVVGQDEVVDQTLTALFADGHVLLEGVPGLGKTLLVRSLGQALALPYARIQFTPDVMPADITGTSIVDEDPRTGRRSFRFRPGPIFHQIILADEINRATPKSQSALLEAMQERSVSVDGETRHLDRPFLVLATQNPIEQEGTYVLPEAQLDRFLFKITVPYATRREMSEILKRTTGSQMQSIRPVLDVETILKAQALARRIVIAPHVQDFAVRLVLATHPGSGACPKDLVPLIAVGVSPRAAQAIVSTARIRALIDGRYAVGFKDIEAVAYPALRHRLKRSFEAEADGITTDDIVTRLLETIPHASPEATGDG